MFFVSGATGAGHTNRPENLVSTEKDLGRKGGRAPERLYRSDIIHSLCLLERKRTS